MDGDVIGRDGLYECTDCGRKYDSEKSLVFCCNPAALRGVGALDPDNA